MVFQRPNPFPTMSIRDNVLAGVKLNNKRISKSDADALVEKSLTGANLWNEVKDRLTSPDPASPAASSSACALPAPSRSRPQVILMDEPCSALDPISTLAIEDLIEELKTQYTVVIVTHNMQQAARVSRQDGVLQHRRHRQAGQADRDTAIRRRSSATPSRRPPRTTSPAASDKPPQQARRRCLPTRGRHRRRR